MNHKYIRNSIISFVVIFLVFGAQFALAGGLYSNLDVAAGSDLKKNSDIVKFIGSIVGVVLSLLGVALVLVLIYAGIMWGFLSADDAKKVQTAKDMIKNAVIGLIIVFAAYGITQFVMSSLSKTTNQSGQPILDPLFPGGPGQVYPY
ncbi:MAG: hypothetical protein WCT26_00290 [Candidatus Buchananbacteria bacterium]|jgi:hypothetical protein